MDFIDHRSTAQFKFLTSATDEKIRINAGGDLLVGISTPFDTSGITLDATGALGVDGHITVATGATYDIGTATNKFRNLYLSGDINVAGASTSGDLTVGGSLSVTTDATVTGSLTVSTDATITNDLTVSNDATITGDLTVSTNAVIAGDLTVNGTTTTINTETLDVKDKNITLNYGGDTISADGAGITIEDAVSAGTDATILWDGSSDTFDFSHAIDVTGTITADNNLTIQNPNAYGSIELGGVSGGFIDIKRPFSDDYDLRLIAEGDGGVINVASGELTIQRAGSAKLATTSTGVAVTGNATFGDNGKAIFGAGTDLQIYHDGTHSRVVDAGTGNLNLQGDNLRLKTADAVGTYLEANNGGAVTITYNSSPKLATTSTGIDVTGVITTDGMTTSADINFGDNDKAIFGAGSDLQIYHDGSNSYISEVGTGELVIQARDAVTIEDGTSGDNYVYMQRGNKVSLFYAGAEKLATTSTGIAVTGNATFGDNDKAVFGTGSDLQIYHDGSNSIITDGGTGSLLLRGSNVWIQNADGTETGARFITDGAIDLRYDNSVKLATTSTGIDVTGDITLGDTNPTITFNDSSVTNLSHTISSASDNLRIRADVNGVDSGSRVEIFDGTTEVARFEAGAVDVTGTVTADALTVANTGSASTLTLTKTDGSAFTASAGNYSILGTDDSTNLYFKTNGSFRQLINSNGDISFYDDSGSAKFFWDASTEFLGLGSTAPAVKLDIVDTSADVQMRVYKNDGTKNTRLTLTADDSGAKIHYRDADNAGALRFNNNLGEVMRIPADTTRLGIGTSSPSTNLEVNTGAASDPIIQVTNSNAAAYRPSLRVDNQHTGGRSYRMFSTATGDGVFGGGKFSIYDDDASASRLTIDSSGRVGIGTSSAEQQLHVHKSDSLASAAVFTNSTTGSTSSDGVFVGLGSGEQGYFWNYETNDLILGTSNAERMRIDSAGRLGLGTSSPAQKMHIEGSSHTRLQITSSTTTDAAIYLGDTDDADIGALVYDNAQNSMKFLTNAAERMRITSAGRVGIGTSSPTNSLEIQNSTVGTGNGSNNTLALRYNSTTLYGQHYMDANGIYHILADNSGSAGGNMQLDADTTIRLATGSTPTERMRIDSSGKVGIGTSSPETNLHIEDSSSFSIIRLVSSTTENAGIDFGDPDDRDIGRVRYNNSDNSMVFHTNAAERMRIDSSGNVGIGTSNPSAKFGINASAPDFTMLQSNAVKFRSGVSGTTNGGVTGSASGDYFARTSGGKMLFSTNDGVTAHAVINSSGNLLVGRTSVGTTGTGHSIRGGDSAVFARAGGEVAIFSRSDSDGEILRFDGNGSAGVGSIATVNSNIYLGTGDTGLYFNAGDDTVMPINVSTASGRDAGINLGKSDTRFKDLYLSGTAYTNALGVGTTSPDVKVDIVDTAADVQLRVYKFDGTNNTRLTLTADDSGAKIHYRDATNGGALRFNNNAGEMARFDASGNLLVGTTSAGPNVGGLSVDATGSLHCASFQAGGNGYGIVLINSAGTTVGSIVMGASATAYNTSSDQRLKDSIVDAPSASDDIDAIQVRSFDWKADGSHQKYGMVAQELNTVAPEAVSTPEDPEEMMGVDYSKLVPMLVKEIQSLRARVAQLETN